MAEAGLMEREILLAHATYLKEKEDEKRMAETKRTNAEGGQLALGI